MERDAQQQPESHQRLVEGYDFLRRAAMPIPTSPHATKSRDGGSGTGWVATVPKVQSGPDAVTLVRYGYAEVFGENTRSRHNEFLRKRITWRLQANEQGGPSARARRRAEVLAQDSDLRLIARGTWRPVRFARPVIGGCPGLAPCPRLSNRPGSCR
jgi:hypothetical protein